MRIHEKLWVAFGARSGTSTALSYMTYEENNAAFRKRQETGRGWARSGKEESFINEPLEGFEIVSVASRYRTNNKVFRIYDPRDFMVEIPAENLNTLLKNTVIDHGTVMGKCLWGRDGSNHILLPEGSEIYQKAVEDNTRKTSAKMTPTKVKPGNLLADGYDSKYIYMGRYSGTVVVSGQARMAGRGWSNRDNSDWRAFEIEVPFNKLYALSRGGRELFELRKTFRLAVAGDSVYTEDERAANEDWMIGSKQSYYHLPKVVQDLVDAELEKFKAGWNGRYSDERYILRHSGLSFKFKELQRIV